MLVYIFFLLMQRDTNGLTVENKELKLRLQAMEQQAHLRDGTLWIRMFFFFGGVIITFFYLFDIIMYLHNLSTPGNIIMYLHNLSSPPGMWTSSSFSIWWMWYVIICHILNSAWAGLGVGVSVEYKL